MAAFFPTRRCPARGRTTPDWNPISHLRRKGSKARFRREALSKRAIIFLRRFPPCGPGHSAFLRLVQMSGTKRGADQMAHISRITVERALRSLEEAPSEAIGFHHATEAAHVL